MISDFVLEADIYKKFRILVENAHQIDLLYYALLDESFSDQYIDSYYASDIIAIYHPDWTRLINTIKDQPTHRIHFIIKQIMEDYIHATPASIQAVCGDRLLS